MKRYPVFLEQENLSLRKILFFFIFFLLSNSVTVATEDNNVINNNVHNKKMEDNNLLKALAMFEKSLEIFPENISAMEGKANVLMRLERYDEAIKELTKSLKILPTNERTLHNRGLCYLFTQIFHLAEDDFSKIVKLNPSNVDAYFYLSIVQFNSMKIDSAIENISKTIQLSPSFPHALFHRAKLYFFNGDIEKAKEDLTKLRVIDPDFTDNLEGENKEIVSMIKNHKENIQKQPELKQKNLSGVKNNKTMMHKILELIAIIGAIASIVSLSALFFTKNNSQQSVPISTTQETVNQSKSVYVKGSENNVILNVSNEADYEPLIHIKRHYRHSLEFSLGSHDGAYEVQLYVEVKKFVKCTPGLIRTEGIGFQNRYGLVLVPNVTHYPLIPLTATADQDIWTLTGKDIEPFIIDFIWPTLTSVDIEIKADIYDYKTNTKSYISTGVIRLDRNGENRTDMSYTPGSYKYNFSPFLYKLFTDAHPDNLIKKAEHLGNKNINNDIFLEIAANFNTDSKGMLKLLKSDRKNEAIFIPKVNPLAASKLYEISVLLQRQGYPKE